MYQLLCRKPAVTSLSTRLVRMLKNECAAFLVALSVLPPRFFVYRVLGFLRLSPNILNPSCCGFLRSFVVFFRHVALGMCARACFSFLLWRVSVLLVLLVLLFAPPYILFWFLMLSVTSLVCLYLCGCGLSFFFSLFPSWSLVLIFSCPPLVFPSLSVFSSRCPPYPSLCLLPFVLSFSCLSGCSLSVLFRFTLVLFVCVFVDDLCFSPYLVSVLPVFLSVFWFLFRFLLFLVLLSWPSCFRFVADCLSFLFFPVFSLLFVLFPSLFLPLCLSPSAAQRGISESVSKR